jgi:hypothetical protein
MTTPRKTFKPDYVVQERISEVKVNGRNLRAGQEVTLWPGAGRKQSQRYRFDWAYYDRGGHLVLELYGPLGKRRPPSYRCVAPSEVKVVHRQGDTT